MKKCIIIPDSFKGTMTALTVSEIMEASILKKYPDCIIETIPFSDGGEGMVDCLLKVTGGERIHLRTMGPFGKTVDSFYGISNGVAFIEMAASAGLTLAKERLDPLMATSYGVGELINDAYEKGIRKIILGLGGSCTNDAGVGMACAMGVKFFDETGKEFLPTGGTLSKVVDIDFSEYKKNFVDVEITALCDINNPMYGKQGAAHVFAPQKGATKDTVKYLDKELRIFARTMEKCTGIKVDNLPGGGAAGAMGAGVVALLGGTLKRGTATILDIVQFDNKLKNCDCVITGEGRLDYQSYSGKVIVGIAEKAKTYNVPVIAIVGENKNELEQLKKRGIISVYETSTNREDFNEIKKYCKHDLKLTMERMLREITFE